MNAVRLSSVAILCVSVLGGCAKDPYAKYKLGAARDTVAAAIDATGGLEAWENVGTIRADALVTLYDSSGSPRTNRMKLVVDVRGGRIEAVAAEAAGWWSAVVTRRGEITLTQHEGQLSAPAKQQVGWALSMILHRLTGPANLLYGVEKPGAVSPAVVAGERVTRVQVIGYAPDAVADYFLTDGGTLRYVTAGDDRPGRGGTITRLTGRPSAGRIALPEKIEIFKIGQHVLLGEEPLLEATLSAVTVE
ncbi:MAG TPA: hypothetical protein PK082_04040 [Phycisphaerae bacterium]|nr:hypothetical protein [Phycisphaerae bacterium]